MRPMLRASLVFVLALVCAGAAGAGGLTKVYTARPGDVVRVPVVNATCGASHSTFACQSLHLGQNYLISVTKVGIAVLDGKKLVFWRPFK